MTHDFIHAYYTHIYIYILFSVTAMTIYENSFPFIQKSDIWVKYLDLKIHDKEVLLSSDKLSDRHMYAAHKLLRLKFASIRGESRILLMGVLKQVKG